MIGASVGTFNHLFRLVSRAVDATAGPPLSRAQRRRLASEAVSRSSLKLLAGAPKGKVKPGIWTTNKAMRQAEQELAQQAERVKSRDVV